MKPSNFKAPGRKTQKIPQTPTPNGGLSLLPTSKPQTLASPSVISPNPATSPASPPLHRKPQSLADAAAGAEAAEAGAADAEAAQGAAPGQRGAMSILPGQVARDDAGTGRALGEQLPHDRRR